MPAKLVFIPGNTYGPYHLLLLERSNRVGKNGKHKWGIYQCPDCGEPFEALNASVKRGQTQRCPSCRITWRKEHSVFNTLNKVYEPGMKIGPNHILFLEEKEPINQKRIGRFLCPICGNEEWVTRLPDICSGASSKCPDCYKKENINRCIINGELSGYDLTGAVFGKLTVQYLIGQRPVDSRGRLWHCACECGNTRDVPSRYLTSGRVTHCGCSTPKSKGEERTAAVLKNLNISFLREYSFPDCINPETNHRLRFDFYLPEYNCCIEYDGVQHYTETPWTNSTLQENQNRDAIKNLYCINHNILLIRIPYWEYDGIDENYISSRLNF